MIYDACINFDHNFYKNVWQVFHNYDIQLIFHLKLDITYFTFECFLSFMNWCNMQIQIIFQTKTNFTFVTFEWFLIYLDQIK